MHIIIGGAYNGKKSYVSQLLADKASTWYEGQLLGEKNSNTQIAVLYAVEKLVLPMLSDRDEVELAQHVFQQISTFQDSYDKVYIILEDMGRGIVPIEATQRKLRDVLGRLYQLLFAHAQTVTRIWYGIPQQLK
ncbi:MAG: bifunctional adenosylcobinamide kinase/adenosylcobinamide-phosphate guanylyltransferase [Kurthia sp.]|nr:bifunctional adenosylcobinamide kinase/adenosylcobinamide-phosphate guanylyltransferase [Candidatus Kurthia equi]